MRIIMFAVIITMLARAELTYGQPVTGNLQVFNVTVTPSQATSGQTVQVGFTVRNLGPGRGQITGANISINFQPPMFFPLNTVFGAVSEQHVFSKPMAVPTRPPGSNPIGYSVDVQIFDSVNASGDFASGNVTVNAPSLPDLTCVIPTGWDREIVVSNAHNAMATPVSIPNGVPVYASFTIKNVGGTTTGNVPLSLTLFPPNGGSSAALSIGSPFGPITPDDSHPVRDFVIPPALVAMPGTYRLFLWIDPSNQVAESNDGGNNQFERFFFIADPVRPNLVLIRLRVELNRQ